MSSGTFYPNHQNDDGYVKPIGASFYNAISEGTVGNSGGFQYHSFVRFANVTIPQGASIISAFIRFTAAQDDSGIDALTDIWADDHDDSPQITSYSGGAPDYTTMAARKTTATVAWDTPTLTAWTIGSTYDTPSLVDIVQEIVNRPGWASGQAMQFMWEDGGGTVNAERRIRSYDYYAIHGDSRPELHVEWAEVVGDGDCTLPALTMASCSGACGSVTLPALTMESETERGYWPSKVAIAMNLKNKAPTQYTNFDFDSFCQFKGYCLAAGPDGIKVLHGNDDEGYDIEASFMLNLTNFGILNQKRIRMVYVSGEADGALTLHSQAEEGTVQNDDLIPVKQSNEQHTFRAALRRDLKGSYWRLGVSNVSGADFSIDTISIVPVIMGKRPPGSTGL